MSSVMDQIRKLEEQKAALLNQAKTEALESAHKAIAALNELGFNYKLVEQGSNSTTSAATGTRRQGIRTQVLSIIGGAEKGITRADLLEMLGAKGDKQAEQSISNALANLKKAGSVNLTDGVYTVA